MVSDLGFAQQHFLRRSDLLFLAKGVNNFAIEYDKNFERAVASSLFFILRKKSPVILSEYIAWYINSAEGQSYLHSEKVGTSITNINKSTLEEMTIPIPPIDVQAKIAEVEKLKRKEKNLTELILKKKQLLVENILLNQIEK